ncbi:hypothetical protein SAMD00019534_120350 [Acytostelium subglobosum LB1]|uniref:hypothetical protein n=1 Tax=Acytostelium subglobosum LB1 TaxID=1410327 RepID=UPI00064491E0|nr:hypothetical protein SAMD00019534_120350 [Acytostelium subglobosum LB1]GAM28859.1 hypothetical protein SAMD00019534_120350 [Acytostelium subglobosum LB1]|eukprot:XP_012748231.1 hypothetical protein SAMD00019534_120350 [Acytostelium subglobosum LB1]
MDTLSHIILQRIVIHIEEDADRLFLSLTCRRLFDDRDKYLSFSTNMKDGTIAPIVNKRMYERNLFCTKSYYTCFMKSAVSSSPLTLENLHLVHSTNQFEAIPPQTKALWLCNNRLRPDFPIPYGVEHLTFADDIDANINQHYKLRRSTSPFNDDDDINAYLVSPESIPLSVHSLHIKVPIHT